MSEEEKTETVSMQGRCIVLPSGASVAGFRTDTGSFAWVFERKGVKVPLCLSPDAMYAMMQVFQDLIDQPYGPPVTP